MRSALQLLGGVAVAGAVAVGGTALTGTGLATTAGASQFVGGQVTQTVSGATLASVAYGYVNATTKTDVNQITLTFADATGNKVPTAVQAGGTWSIVDITNAFTCTAIANGTFISTCTPFVSGSTLNGITSLAVAVS